MNGCCRIVCALATLAVGMTGSAQAQDAGTIHVVTYIEAQAKARREAAAQLTMFREAARKDAGNLAADAVESLARVGHFVILTAWKDREAFDAHMAAAHTKEFRDKLHAVRNSPTDDRIHNSLSVASAEAGRAARSVYVITHVDVPPPRKDECVTLLKKLADASRRDAGNVRFDVVQQTNRPNHFTVIEVWKDRKAFDGHVMTAHVREFRDQLTPMSGALYDERLFRVLK
jgi:quinol monooxygenase YgiN